MVLPVLVLSGIFQLVRIVLGEELSVIRHADGDIFTVEGSCNGACVELSSGTGSPYSRGTATSTTGISITNGTCVCQCNGALPVFREDLHICVSDIHECSVAGFVSNSGLVEKVPYVFLPQREQIIYPQAEIRFEGVTTPVCGIAGSQQLGKSGWLELRNLSNAEPPFRLFRDEGRTFLQWIGEDGLRDAAEGKVVVAKLVCRDASPNSNNPGVFIPCVAFRVAGSPSKTNIREVTFAATGQASQGLSTTEYTAIGISSVLLALIYVASVSLYLHSRKARRKSAEEPEVAITGGREGAGLVKNNPLLVASRHYESDTNSGPSDDDIGDELAQSDGEQGFENPSYCSQQVTSAIIHPHCMYLEHPEGPFGTGSILGERIPDEDVRIVETIDNTYQHETPVLPGTQRRKLYFNPAYFERQLLLAPPPAAIEFLMKIREVISIAKHKMTAKRFVPTLTGIPEEETSSERCSSATNKQRASSIQDSVARSRKSQRCDGCPGCTESPSKGLPQLPDTVRSMIAGDSRVRAWLEDVKPPERRWRDAEEGRRNFQENARTFARNFEYLREMAKIDFLHSSPEGANNLTSKSLATWKDNPPMLRTFRNIARSEILEDDDRHSVSKRSTKSMFEESNYDRYCRSKKTGSSSPDVSMGGDGCGGGGGGESSTINAKVRRAIENSFIKQMEENATTLVDESSKNARELIDGSATVSSENIEDPKARTIERKLPSNGTQKRSRKSKAPSAPVVELPDMINQLPSLRIPPRRIMDAVIREMVDAKVVEHHSRVTSHQADYEIDSLERTNRRETQVSPELMTRREEINDVILGFNDERPGSEINNDRINTEHDFVPHEERVLRFNCCNKNNLPELVSLQRAEGYSLVSEVYVNDGYASPAGSYDSGPEISYEPENPGHLTIKVQDSPENYVKQDDSEYEPDTLDRKPMRLRINGDVNYEREKIASESYVDSLERPGHIMLRSKGSFRDLVDCPGRMMNVGAAGSSLQRGYGSLREIYEARLRSHLRDSSFMSSTRSLNGELDNTLSWRKNKYLTPDTRQAKRQRKPQNQPDVVPLPPVPSEEIYQKPKPLRRVEQQRYTDPSNNNVDDPSDSVVSKNELDRSKSEAGDHPTASDGSSPVLEKLHTRYCVGNQSNDRRDDSFESATPSRSVSRLNNPTNVGAEKSQSTRPAWRTVSEPPWKIQLEKRSQRHLTEDRPSQASNSIDSEESLKKIASKRDSSDATVPCTEDAILSKKYERDTTGSDEKARKNFTNDHIDVFQGTKTTILPISRIPRSSTNPMTSGKVEDSGYLSSTDSNESRKQLLLRHDNGSVSETDETESMCDGASESGAESVGTDSVFFGNFRRSSDVSNFSKSVDSGVDFSMRNTFLKPFGGRNVNATCNPERSSVQASDSESESFVTVLPPSGGSRRNSLVL